MSTSTSGTNVCVLLLICVLVCLLAFRSLITLHSTAQVNYQHNTTAKQNTTCNTQNTNSSTITIHKNVNPTRNNHNTTSSTTTIDKSMLVQALADFHHNTTSQQNTTRNTQNTSSGIITMSINANTTRNNQNISSNTTTIDKNTLVQFKVSELLRFVNNESDILSDEILHYHAREVVHPYSHPWTSWKNTAIVLPKKKIMTTHGQKGKDAQKRAVRDLFKVLARYGQRYGFRYGLHLETIDIELTPEDMLHCPRNVVYIIAMNINITSCGNVICMGLPLMMTKHEKYGGGPPRRKRILSRMRRVSQKATALLIPYFKLTSPTKQFYFDTHKTKRYRIRDALWKRFYNHSSGITVDKDLKNETEWFETLADSQFVVSPEGGGIDCFRHWESLLLGAIPVVERSPVMLEYAKHVPLFFVDSEKAWHSLPIDEAWWRSKYEDLSAHASWNLKFLTTSYWRQRIDDLQQLL
eukprot:gnl/MRDRNA2_/MRDRNA2_35110_c0_seq1.p1 gnl/MRDRNA2_/MRDRNA2_35110_c0~~gnl/MRDRNA2_/MRDRNA2_35110_c0_seq1.p1  ORF type:complete len:467 (-),score=46.50 gnl/MRDRNA2_/MRDRNA2_35110_c0_seq1:109-1509(-)